MNLTRFDNAITAIREKSASLYESKMYTKQDDECDAPIF